MADPRFELEANADERRLLETFLQFQRDALVRKCDGLSDDELRRSPIPSSTMSLAGLVRHLATVERWYFQGMLGQSFPGSIYDHDSDEAFTGVAASSRAEAFGVWNAEVAASIEITRGLQLDDVRTNFENGDQRSVRWVLLHMIDEYARHLGHADVLREAIDGQRGE